jgi:ubiquitin-protein ligase
MQNDQDVQVLTDEGRLAFIYKQLSVYIIFVDGNIHSHTELPEEILFVKLLKHRTDRIVDLDYIVECGKQLLPVLTNYCICCANQLEYPSDKFITCGMDACLYQLEELIIDDYVKDSFTSEPIICKFLLKTAYNAINSQRRDKIFEPFPTNFLLDKNVQLERGKLSSLSKQDLKSYKDFDSLDTIVKKYPITKLLATISTCKTDRDIADEIGDNVYKLIKFIIKSNRTKMRSCQLINNFVLNTSFEKDYSKQKYLNDVGKFIQIEVKHDQEIEDQFTQEIKKYNSIFLFHGSSYENWYSIIRNGLKICSNTGLMTAGAAYGTGIYLSNDINLSLGYTGITQGECIFGVYEVLNIPQKLRNISTIFVANDEQMLLLRYLFVAPSAQFIRQLDLNKVLNEKFRTKIQAEKKVVAQRSNNIRTKRLFSEYKKIVALDSNTVGFRVELAEEDNLDIWKIFITNFDNNLNIKQNLMEIGVNEVEMEISFPDKYPIEPPFIRIVSPRFVYQTGHITSGGSICMELLTKSGWSAMYSIESLIIDIKCQIVEGDGQIDMARWRQKYTLDEARQSFFRVAKSHGW